MVLNRRRSGVAFVLSGGGNQGVSQVGMLRALLERDIVPDVIVGASAGALNGAAIAADPTLDGVDRLAEMWTTTESSTVFPEGRIARMWNVIQRGPSLFSSTGLADVVERARRVDRFEELAVPLRVVATDLDSGVEVLLSSGPLHPAMLASAALPGVFPPVEHDGRRLIDGGVVNNVPIWHALSGPVDRIYVCNVSGELAERATRSPLDVVMRAFTISRTQRYQLERRNAPKGVEIIDLPRPADGRELFDFDGGEQLIDEAHALVAAALDAAPPKRRLRLPRRRKASGG